MENKTLISANWKMHLTHLEAIRMLQELSFLLDEVNYEKIEIAIHPPFTSLRSVQILIDDMKKVELSLGAQNCHFAESGAYTGEISPAMLAALQVKYVIVGHSERRQLFEETDDFIAKKLAAIWQHKMTPILAIGETLEERDNDQTESKIHDQLDVALMAAQPKQIESMVIAYEPIWAIGTGESATPQDIEAVVEIIRSWIKKNKNEAAAKSVRIQYGGSVKPINIGGIMGAQGVDGVLVGGASIDASEFARIVRYQD